MNILADTCFWISLCDPTEQDHVEVEQMMLTLLKDKRHIIMVPHPVLYETLCSEMVKKPNQVMLLTRYFSHVEKVSDEEYVKEAYRLVEQQASMQKGTASMVDLAIMLMADDPKNNVRGILTCNGRDFSSFCQKRGIPMIDNMSILNAV